MEGKLTALLRELRRDKDAIDWTPPALERLVRELDEESKKRVSNRADTLSLAPHTKQAAKVERDNESRRSPVSGRTGRGTWA